MKILATIGQFDSSIQYIDRPTVKVVIKNDDKILILNKGLLPGGGVDAGESDHEAITRELQEELGTTVKDIQEIGYVVQYRNFLGKKYLVYGYSATLASSGGATNPQDEGEAQFSARWMSIQDALAYVTESIEEAKARPIEGDGGQGRVYNLMSTYEFLRGLSLTS